MMPNVTRGSGMTGLLTYLCGPGKTNEHTDPHLVAGDPAMLAWHDDAHLDRGAAVAIAHYLDEPRKALDVDVKGGHVWHCSLSIRAEEGALPDQRWQEIANDFVAAMEFDDNDGTKAPCRWVAVHHGLSGNGNDHIHIAVNLVREDGTKASTFMDFKRAQTAARALEVKYGLQTLESLQAERSTRGYHPAEREAQARGRARAKYERERSSSATPGPEWRYLTKDTKKGLVDAQLTADQPAQLLALKVRAAATASGSEADFVRRLRRNELLVRPRFAKGRTDVVEGYSVAARPQYGEPPVFYGGGRMGSDLSIERLRLGWPDTPEGATEAAAEWTAAKRNRRVVSPSADTVDVTPQQWSETNARLERLVEKVRAVPVEDRDRWATIARGTAGALAAWSNAVEDTPGDLAAASEMLSRSAQTHRAPIDPVKARGAAPLRHAAQLFATASRGGQGTVAQAIMLRQIFRLARAVSDTAQATQQARLAEALAKDTAARLVRVREGLPTPVPQPAMAGVATVAAPELEPKVQAILDRIQVSRPPKGASPVPSKVEPYRPPTTTRTGAERGIER